jgi:hypothetical protein
MQAALSVHDLAARQVVWQRLALWLGTLGWRRRWRRIRRLGAGVVRRLAGLQFLRPQFELLDLAADPLRRAAELHPPQLGDLELEFLDLQRLDLYRRLRRLERVLARQRKRAQRVGFGGQFGSGERHAETYQGQDWRRSELTESEPSQTSIGCCGNGGATVRR